MKAYGAIRTVIYWVLTALVFVFLSDLAEIETLRYFIGGLIILYGAEELIYTAFKHKKHFSLRSLYWNLVEIVIGIVLIAFVDTEEEVVTYAVVCVCWAIWSILRETRELVEVTEELREKKPITCKVALIISLLESLTIIALSLMLLIEPGEHHAKIHLYLLTVELFTKALFPIIHFVAEHFEEKKKKAAEHEADEPQPEQAVGEVAASAEEQQIADNLEEEKQNSGVTEEELTK